MLQPYWIYQTGEPACSPKYNIISVVVHTSSQSLVKWKLVMSDLLPFPNFDRCLDIIHISMSLLLMNISFVGFPANFIFMADLLYVEYLTSLKKHVLNLCPCNLMFVTEWKVFGSVPSRHLTLDKAAGTAPCAVKVIYCWLCSL